MKNKKGFTLIELLAVIVILAIIALIAVPVIMNIITQARKSSFKDTAYSIIKSGELYYADKLLDVNGMQEDVTITLPDTTNALDLKGDIPTGSITITKDGKVSIGVTNGQYCITKGFDDSDITITEEYEECKNPVEPEPIMTSEHACVTSGTCTTEEINAGVLVNVKVNDSQNYDFYVIADNGTQLTLIMNKNLGNQVAWYKDSDDTTDNEKNNLGPITALNYLNSETSTWTNIDPITSYQYDNNLNGTTNTYGYQKLVITEGEGILTSQDGATTTLTGTSRARLLTYGEANALYTANSYVTPTWLYTNLSSSNTTEQPSGYWFLTAYPSHSDPGRLMGCSGKVTGSTTVFTEVLFGVRPVITLSKSLIS